MEKKTQALYASGMLEQQFGHLREAVIAMESVSTYPQLVRYLIQALKLEIKRKNTLGAELAAKAQEQSTQITLS